MLFTGSSCRGGAQTSNEHLDELNARAQAIRVEDGELGVDGLAIPGRPYQLHAGDEVQVRHSINHPDYGPLRNGTGATVVGVNPEAGEVTLGLASGDELALDREQTDQADLRLAYAQHPFPAQGHTTDTTHVVVAGQATREGTYVALTRAREQTHTYATTEDMAIEADRLAQLAKRVSETEPEVPSISTPLAHEIVVTTSAEIEASIQEVAPAASAEITREPAATPPRKAERAEEPRSGINPAMRDVSRHELVDQLANVAPEDGEQPGRPMARTRNELEGAPQRAWPGCDATEPDGREWETRPEREDTPGWEI